MQLRALIEGIETLSVEGPLAGEVTGLAYEGRRVAPGDIYFALERPELDGHREIELAVERGAVAVVCQKNRAMRQRATVIEVADPRAALAEISALFYGNPSENLRVIAVCGHASAWKTAFFLTSILRRSGVRTGLISTLRHEIGDRRLPSGLSLESSDLQRLLSEMVQAACGTCVLQIPQISLEASRGISMDLLILAGDEQSLWRLSEFMNCSTARRPACGIVNVEKQDGREAARAVLFDAHVTFGFSSAAQVSAQDVVFTTESSEGILYIGNESLRIELPLIGRENLRHLLAATAAAFACDVAPKQIGEALQSLPALPGSLELVPNNCGPAVFVDEARTERALELALRSLRELTHGRILLAFGATEKTSRKERFGMGRIAAAYAQHIILTSDNPGREPVEQICSVVAQGIESSGSSAYHFQPDRGEAIAELIAMAREGDALLISGKGDRTYQELASTIVPFDDRTVVAERLATIAIQRARAARRVLVPA